MTKNTTLGHRGYELATGPSIRDLFKKVLSNPYNPDTNPEGFINIGTAENYAMIPEIKAFVNEHIKLNSFEFTYGEGPWGSARLRTAMAKHMTKKFPSIEKIDPEDILIANGVTSICEMLGFTVFDEGDGILLPSPIYQAFASDFGLKAKVKVVYVRFGEDDQFDASTVSHWESTILEAEKAGTKIRAIMLCNPHNPLGRCYPKSTIIALMKLCAKYSIHMFCDEIYAASVYDVPGDEKAVPFTSVLSFDYTPYISSDYVHVIYGLSKDLAAGGTRVGSIYIKNKELMRAMSAVANFHWTGSPSDVIASTMLENEDWLDAFLELGRSRLAERNMLARKLLGELGIKFTAGANAGFFLWLDLGPFLPTEADVESYKNDAHLRGEVVTWDDEDVNWQREDLMQKKLMENSVFLTNGKLLGSERPGYFRLIFSQDERVLREGMARVGKTIGRKLS